MTEGLSFQNILLVKGRHKKFKPRQSVLLITMFYCLFNAREDSSVQFSSVIQSCPTLCDPMNHSTPGRLSITNSRILLKPTSIESVMPSSHLILCCTLLFMPPIPPSIRVFSNESTLHKPIAKLQGCHHLPSGTHPLFLFAFH